MANPKCPLLNKPCIEHQCKFWIHMLGKHPQTGKAVDHFDCTFSWLPVLLVENVQAMGGAQAAIESFRNEMVEANNGKRLPYHG